MTKVNEYQYDKNNTLKSLVEGLSKYFIGKVPTIRIARDTRAIAIKIPGATICSMVLTPEGNISTITLHSECYRTLKCFRLKNQIEIFELVQSHVGEYVL